MTIAVRNCPTCGDADLRRYGRTADGRQKYRCHACGVQTRDNPRVRYPPERQEEILRAYEERGSLRGMERIFGVSRATIIRWIKKKRSNSTR